MTFRRGDRPIREKGSASSWSLTRPSRALAAGDSPNCSAASLNAAHASLSIRIAGCVQSPRSPRCTSPSRATNLRASRARPQLTAAASSMPRSTECSTPRSLKSATSAFQAVFIGSVRPAGIGGTSRLADTVFRPCRSGRYVPERRCSWTGFGSFPLNAPPLRSVVLVSRLPESEPLPVVSRGALPPVRGECAGLLPSVVTDLGLTTDAGRESDRSSGRRPGDALPARSEPPARCPLPSNASCVRRRVSCVLGNVAAGSWYAVPNREQRISSSCLRATSTGNHRG